MKQSRDLSLVRAIANVAVGYGPSVVRTNALLPETERRRLDSSNLRTSFGGPEND